MILLKSALLLFCLTILNFAVAKSRTADDIQRLITEHDGDSKALSTISAASWVDSPKVRGTVDILLTCVVTLFACVWSVLHLNIPVKRGRYAGFLDKLRWTVMTILFPDTVLVIAAYQWITARSLRKELETLQLRKNTSRPIDVPLNFCFFVEMGGFQVDLDREGISLGLSFMASGPERLPLSPAGFLKLIEMELLDLETLIQRANVTEKSKANVFQKLLIATQVLWMFIQCIARKLGGLPIILLEIHTMVHIVCALVVLISWTSKPLDLNTPELFGSESDGVVGFISLAIQSQLCPEQKFVLGDLQDSQSHAGDNEDIDVASNTAAIPSDFNQNDLEIQREIPHSLELRQHETLPFGLKYEDGPILYLRPTDIRRLRRATQFLRDHGGANVQLYNQALPRSDFNSLFSAGGNYALPIDLRYGDPLPWLRAIVVILGPGSYRHEGVPLQYDYRISVSTLFVTLIYSGLHLSAWSGRFPTQVEEICWKTASIIPIGNAVFTSLLIYFNARGAFDSMPEAADFIISVIGLFAVGTLNGIARLYLTVESFASLRDLPIGAFSMPVWLQLFPHL